MLCTAAWVALLRANCADRDWLKCTVLFRSDAVHDARPPTSRPLTVRAMSAMISDAPVSSRLRGTGAWARPRRTVQRSRSPVRVDLLISLSSCRSTRERDRQLGRAAGIRRQDGGAPEARRPDEGKGARR